MCGRFARIFLPISSSAGDFPYHGIGVDLYDRSARNGSSALFRRCLTCFTALSACPLLDGKWGAAGCVAELGEAG